jgi:hypothetical protein
LINWEFKQAPESVGHALPFQLTFFTAGGLRGEIAILFVAFRLKL